MVNLSYTKIAFFPVSGNRYLTSEERARAATAIAAQARLIAQQEGLAKQEAEQKAQRLAERLRSLGITPMKCKGGFQAILGD
jgi:predicted N-acyltransferase